MGTKTCLQKEAGFKKAIKKTNIVLHGKTLKAKQAGKPAQEKTNKKGAKWNISYIVT